MKVAVPAEAAGMEASPSAIFGRTPFFVIVDSATMAAETLSNPATSSPGGAGVQAAQLLVSQGVGAVIASNVGPNASAVLQTAGIDVYLLEGETVGEAVAALLDDRLELLAGPTVASHTGTRGRPAGGGNTRAQQSEIASLTQEAAELRQRLDEISSRLEDLEGTDA